MSKVQYVLFYLTLLSFICRCPSLVELPTVEDNSIMETEAVIRNTINQIFSLLKLQKVKEKPKLKQYGQIHNYFTSVTLKDYNNLKEIAQLTRVDNKNVDNITLNFIALINYILNADSFAENEENNVILGEYITDEAANYLQRYLKDLNYFEEIVSNSPQVDVNEKVAKILESIHIEDLNITEKTYDKPPDEDNHIFDKNELWQPIAETRRIFQGKRTRIKTFPFMAVILAFNVFQCAGSIIHSDLVLTAASCLQLAYNNRFYRENPAFLSVRVGSNFHDGGGEVIAILEVFFHPSYSPKTLRHNLAVIRLVRHLKLTTKRVKKIAIDKIAAPLPSNIPGITIIGWGASTASNIIKHGFDNKLSYAILDVYDLRDCRDIYSKEYVTQRNFCAGFISKGSGACNRDVGGPGVAAGILRGVVSFGSPQCGTPDAPTVFTKVGYYTDWIETIMEQDIPRGRKLTTLRTTYWMWSTLRTTATDYRITPVPKVSVQTELLSPGTTTRRPIGRQNKKVDMKLFREFLKTVFNSNEIDEYLDQFMSEKGTGRELGTPTTEDFTAVEFATKNINVEPETLDYEAEWTTATVNITTTDKSVTHRLIGIQSKKEIDAEKELEKDIIELINDADLREILLESVSTATIPSLTQKTKKQKKKKTKKAKKAKNKEKKSARTGKEQELTEQQKSGMVKKTVQKNKIQKDNENVMKFLYLSDDEKDIENIPKIYNKADDGSQDGQDIVLHMTQEENYDDSVYDNNITAGDGDDTSNNEENVGENYNVTELTTTNQEQQDIGDEEVFQGDGIETAVADDSQGDTDIDEVDHEDERKGLDISFDIPSIPEVLANPAPLQLTIPPFETQIALNFRAVGAQSKSDAQLESKKVIIDILNEVMIADETKSSATNTLATNTIPTANTRVSSQIVYTATKNQTLS